MSKRETGKLDVLPAHERFFQEYFLRNYIIRVAECKSEKKEKDGVTRLQQNGVPKGI